VAKAFEGIDLTLHAGGIHLPSMLDDPEEIAPVTPVRDKDDYRIPQHPRPKETCLLRVEGVTIGLAHALEYTENLGGVSRHPCKPTTPNGIKGWAQ